MIILWFIPIGLKTFRPFSRSQKGEDVSLKWTFDNIGTTNKYYVEFGAIDGFEDCNTHYFREVEGWNGLLLESGKWFPVAPNDKINLQIETVSKENINSIFKNTMCPKSLIYSL